MRRPRPYLGIFLTSIPALTLLVFAVCWMLMVMERGTHALYLLK